MTETDDIRGLYITTINGHTDDRLVFPAKEAQALYDAFLAGKRDVHVIYARGHSYAINLGVVLMITMETGKIEVGKWAKFRTGKRQGEVVYITDIKLEFGDTDMMCFETGQNTWVKIDELEPSAPPTNEETAH